MEIAIAVNGVSDNVNTIIPATEENKTKEIDKKAVKSEMERRSVPIKTQENNKQSEISKEDVEDEEEVWETLPPEYDVIEIID